MVEEQKYSIREWQELEEKIEKEKREWVYDEETGGITRIEKGDEGTTKIEQSRRIIRENYDKIREVLREYLDITEEDKTIITLWILGTYYHKEFETYPYLFINAMRGSGKTRLCKLLSYLSWNGFLLTSLKEATLFRLAGKKTLGVDEFEHVGKKENENLRELLNASYKKGLKVTRMKKVKKRIKDNEGKEVMEENHEMEEFEPYTPIYMANIWGMDEVLGDRCISMILEKSNNPLIVNKIEDFDNNLLINQIRNNFSLGLVKLCSFWGEKSIYTKWNTYVNERYTTLTSETSYTTFTTLTTPKSLILDDLFKKISDSGVMGRNLELWMPLFIMGKICGEEVCNNIITIAKRYVNNKKIDENMDSKDVQLYQFVAKREIGKWNSIKGLCSSFRFFVNVDDSEDQWLNTKWFGRALKRLNLVIDKRRVGEGVEITLNVPKAIKQLENFR